MNTFKVQSIIKLVLSILGYGLILMCISVLFPNTIYIDNAYFGLWGFIASTIIFIINRWFKPLIVWLTIPITALTLGIFYPFINVFILHIVHFILRSHFVVNGIFMSFIVALLISLMNYIMNNIIFKPLRIKGDES